MKRAFAFLLTVITVIGSLAGCRPASSPAETAAVTKDEATLRAEAYAAAVLALSDDTLSEDGTYTVSEELLSALENITFTEPKNIIYMIGDGMGFNQLTGAEAMFADQMYQGKMAWRCLPMVSSQSTSSASATVTDSAAGGTALATGFRTTNGVLGLDAYAETVFPSVLELAAEQGKSTGIVVTKNVTDATPASFTVHVDARGEEFEIASQQADKLCDGTLDLLLGGGATYFDENEDDLIASLSAAGITYRKELSEVASSSLPILGLFADEKLDTSDPATPTLAEMTDLALDKLSQDENGFFLLIEGSQIDTYGHESDLERQLWETYQFDCALAVALRFTAMHPDTVIIVTADHETGGLMLPAYPTKENVTEAYYTSDGSHTETDVPLLAIGYGVEALSGINHNTDCAVFVASLLGKEGFGEKKEVHTLLDTSLAENVTAVVEANAAMATPADTGIAITFDTARTTLSLPVEALDFSMKELRDGPRTIVMTLKNVGNAPILPPTLTLCSPKIDVVTGGGYVYLAPGESRRVTYVLPLLSWHPSKLQGLEEFTLSYSEGESASLILSDLYLTERPFDT